MAVDKEGNLYVGEWSNRIRKIDKLGMVTTIAGTGKPGYRDGKALQAMFRGAHHIVFDANGNLYISDSGNERIRKLDKNGIVSTVAGAGYEGYRNGPASQALFHFPRAMAFDREGNLYIVDYFNYMIRKLDTNGIVSRVAGNGKRGFRDGPGEQAMFSEMHGIAVDKYGNIYVSDLGNNRIRKIDRKGWVSTVAGSGKPGGGRGGYRDGGLLTSQFGGLGGITFGPDENLYVAESRGIIRQVNVLHCPCSP